jgi:hypothetical protein
MQIIYKLFELTLISIYFETLEGLFTNRNQWTPHQISYLKLLIKLLKIINSTQF